MTFAKFSQGVFVRHSNALTFFWRKGFSALRFFRKGTVRVRDTTA